VIKLKVLSREDAEQIRLWRNEYLDTLRTPFPLTKEQQSDWYNNVICNRQANARWFGIWRHLPATDTHMEVDDFIGYTGIENISWGNRQGEVSMLIGTEFQGNGYSTETYKLILNYAFNELNLDFVNGEVYCSNEKMVAIDIKTVEKNGGEYVRLPKRKYLNGKYYDSLYVLFPRPA